MSTDSLIEFYDFTFRNEDVQSKLINTSSVNDFIEMAVKVGCDHGFYFSKEEMRSTVTSQTNDTFIDGLTLESLWIDKIMKIGWVPKGYTR